MAAYEGSTAWLNSNPNLSITVYYWDPVRDGTNLTQRITFLLHPCGGYDYWGYGCSVSWGYFHPVYGNWIQGESHLMVDTSVSQWGEIWWEPAQISLDVGHDAGTLHVNFNIYSDGTGQWGTASDTYISYGSTTPPYIGPSRGDVSYYPTGIRDPYDAAWFSTIHIDYSNFNGGTAGIQKYSVYKYEWADYSSATSSYRSGIGEIWTSATGGSGDWDGKPPYPMYYFRNVQTGKYLDVVDGIFQNDQRIQTYDFNGSQAQRWGLESISGTSDRYYLHPDCAFEAMIHTVNTGTTSGTELCLWTYTGAPTTQWLIDPTGDPDGSVYIRCVANTNQVIDANVDTGGITIWEFYAQDNQKWIMEDASNAWLGKWMSFDVQVMSNDNVECEAYNQNSKLRMHTIPGYLTQNYLSIGYGSTDESWKNAQLHCGWSAIASENSLRSTDTYEILIERSYNGIWQEFHRGFTTAVSYDKDTGLALMTYSYRFKVRAYNIYNDVGSWSEYSTDTTIAGPPTIEDAGCTAYIVQNGAWVPVYLYIAQDGNWKYSTFMELQGS